MPERRRTYAEWQARRSRSESWAQQVLGALPTRRRERPRDPEEAALLRAIGTPEELIGPAREETNPRP